MFTVKSIRIYEGCKHVKNLKTGEPYIFEHRLSKNFFSDNICISAIVGQNGAGKSSLLDMMFRIINNFSFCLFKDARRSAADLLTYIEDIYADMTYVIDNHECCVMCRGGFVAFKGRNVKVKFIHILPENDIDINWRKQFEDYVGVYDCSFNQKQLFAEEFFYTIATNYSIQAFVASDYAHEETFTYDPELGEDNNKGGYVFKHTGSWLNNLFHKNDGYLTPIVLNPYRSDGWINMTNEEHLTVTRLTAILLDSQLGNQFLDGYTLDKMHFKIQPRTLQEKFYDIESNEKLYPNNQEVDMFNKYKRRDEGALQYCGDKDLDDFKWYATQDFTYANAILSALGCEVKEGMNKMQLFIREYIVYKVLSIAEKYPSYASYKDSIGNHNLTFYEAQPPNKRTNIDNARIIAKAVSEDKSHIGLKLRQALNFIKVEEKFADDLTNLEFDEKQYEDITGWDLGKMSLEERMEHLPPSIFHTQIYLIPQNENKKSIPLNHLSSGERQLIYLMSTMVYHAINIDSVPKVVNRVKYKRLNLVMDEVEICFHPEYQRIFVNRLVGMLNRMNLNEKFDINVIITTHSPFVLSDIPQCNILYLENGVQKSKQDIINPFGANINDILRQNFFLNQGFMGEFSRNCTKSLIHFLTPHEDDGFVGLPDFYKHKEWNSKTAKDFIDQIGEPMLRMQLQQAFRNSSKIKKEDKIRDLEQEIERLRHEEYSDRQGYRENCD